MVHRRHNRLAALTSTEASLLAALLALPPALLTTTGQPSKSWLATQQARLLATTTEPFPTALLAAQGLLARLAAAAAAAHATTTHRRSAQRAVLCPAHRGLNARLIRAIWLLVHDEITRHARPLRRYLRHPSRYHASVDERDGGERASSNSNHNNDDSSSSSNLGAASVVAVRGLVARLAGIAALWLAPGRLARACPGVEARGTRIEGGCEACILAVVGGDRGMVGDLSAALTGRTHLRAKRGREGGPVLAVLVGAWMRRWEEEEEDDGDYNHGLGNVEALARVVKRVRRAVRQQRRRQRGKDRAELGHAYCCRDGTSGRARDSGYSSSSAADASGGVFSTLERPRRGESRGVTGTAPYAALAYSSSRGSQRRHRQDGCGEGLVAQAAVGYNVYHRERQEISPRQYGFLDATAHAPHHYHHPSPSSEGALYNNKQQGVEEEGDRHAESNNDDDTDADAVWRVFASKNEWYSTQMAILNAEEEQQQVQHPALRATVAPLTLKPPREDDFPHEDVGEADDEGEKVENVYDPAQWTDVSVATTPSTRPAEWESLLREARDGPGPYRAPFAHMLVSSSSVYSTDGPGVPHPPPSAASSSSTSSSPSSPSTAIGDPSPIMPSEGKVFLTPSGMDTAWPDPFATPRNSRSLSSSDENVAWSPGLSPAAFQRALDRLSLGSSA